MLFEPRTARSLLDHLFDAVDGRSIYRSSSFLAGKLGQKIAADNVTIIDDGTIPGLMGTSPFDDEGVPSRRTVVVENGILRSYILNSYAARKLGLVAVPLSYRFNGCNHSVTPSLPTRRTGRPHGPSQRAARCDPRNLPGPYTA